MNKKIAKQIHVGTFVLSEMVKKSMF